MTLGTIMDLCTICNRLLALVRAQQIEMERLQANDQMLAQWKRETTHIEDQLRRIQR